MNVLFFLSPKNIPIPTFVNSEKNCLKFLYTYTNTVYEGNISPFLVSNRYSSYFLATVVRLKLPLPQTVASDGDEEIRGKD